MQARMLHHLCRRTVKQSCVAHLQRHMASGLDALQAEKASVRKHIKSLLRQLTSEQMAAESRQITSRVQAVNRFETAQRSGIFIHCPTLREVDSMPLVAACVESETPRRCYVPFVEDRQANMQLLHLGSLQELRAVPPFNILEPRPYYQGGAPRENVLETAAPLDLLVMPGLGFDKHGNRLGRGGGYYDKFISRCRRRAEEHGWQPPLLVALAFQVQMISRVPAGPQDKTVDVIVTAEREYLCTERAEQEWK